MSDTARKRKDALQTETLQTDTLQTWVDRLAAGEVRLRELPETLSQAERAEVRRRAIARITGASTEHLANYSFDPEVAGARHCENLLGVAQIPIGIVGPVKIRGEMMSPDEPVWVPLATTEGALVASVNRGCRAVNEGDGVTVMVEDVGITRAPVFRVAGLNEARQFVDWVEVNFERIRAAAESTSGHLRLQEIRPQILGTSVFLRFRFHTDDAMGMNMATIAVDHVVRELIAPEIGSEIGVECVALSGNYCVDKKPSMINFLEGRGKRIYAEAHINAESLAQCLKTDAEALFEVQWRKNLVGSIAAGTLAYNAHFANVLAAFFLATGQDPAQVAEAAIGVTTVDRSNGGVHIAVNLPDVPLGAVGGGTGLATQRECLQILGVAADPDAPGQAAMRLAEILGAAVLCGELSLLAALTSSDLARAHRELARGPQDD